MIAAPHADKPPELADVGCGLGASTRLLCERGVAAIDVAGPAPAIWEKG